MPEDWKTGKTTASISFVYQAESVLDSCLPKDRELLLEEIELIKSGQRVLTVWVSVSQFLNPLI